MAGGGVVEVRGDGLLDVWNVELDDANLPGGFPAVDDGGGGGPVAGVQGPLDPLATQRALNPDRAIAAGPAPPFARWGQERACHRQRVRLPAGMRRL